MVTSHQVSGTLKITLAAKSPKAAGLKICLPEYLMKHLERIAASGAI